MTSRCERSAGARRANLANIWLGLLLSLCSLDGPPVFSQDDGTRVPPPPVLKHKRQEAPDPDFQSPLKRDAGDRQQLNGEELRRMRRRRLRQLGQEGGGALGGRRRVDEQDFATPGGQRLAVQGFGAPGAQRLGGQGFGAPGGQRLGGQGFGAPGGQRLGGQGFGAPGGQPFGEPGLGAPGARGFGEPGVAEGGAGRFQERFNGRRQGGLGSGNAMTMGMLGGRKALDLRPLNLSDEQKQKIREIRKASREQAKAVRESLQQRQRDLRGLMFNPKASDAEIKAARREMRQAQDRLDELNLNDWLRIRATLTAEQRQKLPGIAPAVGASQAGGPGPAAGSAVSERN